MSGVGGSDNGPHHRPSVMCLHSSDGGEREVGRLRRLPLVSKDESSQGNENHKNTLPVKETTHIRKEASVHVSRKG